ncbi:MULTISPECIES: bifunctional phosphopantothenoylcysteine decarboxylase/phosphopantothenate--cysteine ligase CoaBC [unclassified Ketobacter]|uniref:bifunctional phosphopantothenoylcysteine decarboxylase/phosphopantothenate--cysteine ligase CoaBC n=1 Tax=unclassified Ketobacter TaxID=2639109 RepID=UPI000F204989|nr:MULTISPECIES: bifunctional phosphopantothenoylcysteine decarboxylase/phosphopantothenate--cysteine ligase CoaBC [unclassified Ketobacter]RLT90705.1 MAG: bifunctional phosphopantothenoylcysteine decarboxylase/phosphopantothenate--cysteine ligase CoaBC [Ketobacter sp. GenoA1]RLT99803.1 MAG: bifunctional phosphopantothenoylcysteine decarboxylase/phosphopantothenate--cysteine ligase CoaBC [Ketobacter sp.]
MHAQEAATELGLANRRIILGVTGGIAAYKSAELIRRLKDLGADVRAVMTPAAQEFITPLTLQALSGNPVHTTLLDTEAEAAMGHIELARWGDLILVAPASADFLARLAHGHGNDLLSTLCLAARCPLAVAPAMNQAMWAAASNQANMDLLQARGVHVFGPAAGEQACGDIGPGRMLEATELAQCTANLFPRRILTGTRVTITAGPTREAIDPVRYISNHSSGKMGFAIAEAARDAGAQVTLISGPVHLPTPDRVKRIDVVSALDMHQASMDALNQTDIFIATAAVADFRVENSHNQKIKKQDNSGPGMTLTLVENPDIVAAVAQHEPKPFTVGFAAETRDVENYARQKIERKNLDMIVANDVSRQDIGFNSDQNAVTVIWKSGQQPMALASKTQIARDLVTLISEHYKNTR